MNNKTVSSLLLCLLILSACGGPTPPQWERITAVCEVPASPAPAAEPDPAAADTVPDDAAAATAATEPPPLPANCTGRVFYLDTANMTKRGGILYVTMRTTAQDSSDPGFGIIRAEANCAGKRLEPSALKEDVYDAAGKLVETARLAVITGEDQSAVLQKACAS